MQFILCDYNVQLILINCIICHLFKTKRELENELAETKKKLENANTDLTETQT